MNSMTGYGCGETCQDGWKVTVELSSVNRKQSEISAILPRELDALENRIRDAINRRISRGRVTARLTLHSSDTEANRSRVNTSVATAAARQLRALSKELKLTSDLTLSHLLRIPGVIETDTPEMDPESLWPAVEAALHQALERMEAMRQREGTHLAKDLTRRISLMRKAAARIHKQAPMVQTRYREQLLERIHKAGVPDAIADEDRLLREIVLFADRSDISEELSRLHSHFDQFDVFAKSKDAIGRSLDFLAQEMNREINTIGSKANDTQISHEVVFLKTELEKFREQSMNVE